MNTNEHDRHRDRDTTSLLAPRRRARSCPGHHRRAAADAERAIAADLPLAPGAVDQITFLGGGWTISLADQILATGATLIDTSGFDPMAALILVQRFAVAAAERKGLDPDRPRSLTRSVILAHMEVLK
jgi:hypothetical protein